MRRPFRVFVVVVWVFKLVGGWVYRLYMCVCVCDGDEEEGKDHSE